MFRVSMFVVFALSSQGALHAQQYVSGFDPARWSVRLPGEMSSATRLPDRILLMDRAYLVDDKPYEGGTTSFRFMTGTPGVNNNSPEADHVLLTLSSSGKIESDRSWGPEDGIMIRILTPKKEGADGLVQIQTSTGKGLDCKNFGTGPVKGLKPKEWQKVVVRDEDNTIIVTVNDVQIATAKIPPDVRKGKVRMLCNREHVGGKFACFFQFLP